MLGTPTSTTVTITDDDTPPTVAWQSATFSDAEDAGPALVTVQLNAVSAFTITVAYATSNGTASTPADYIAASGMLIFAPGETSKNLTIITVNDSTQEGDETVNLTLSSPTNVSLGVPTPATAVVLPSPGVVAPAWEIGRVILLSAVVTRAARPGNRAQSG